MHFCCAFSPLPREGNFRLYSRLFIILIFSVSVEFCDSESPPLYECEIRILRSAKTAKALPIDSENWGNSLSLSQCPGDPGQ